MTYKKTLTPSPDWPKEPTVKPKSKLWSACKNALISVALLLLFMFVASFFLAVGIELYKAGYVFSVIFEAVIFLFVIFEAVIFLFGLLVFLFYCFDNS